MSDRPLVDQASEDAVIGAVLLSDRALQALVVDDGLYPEAFYGHRHKLIFGAMVALADRGEGVDVQTVAIELERRGDLAEVGGTAALDEFTGSVPLLGNVRAYARRVLELRELRQIQQAGHELAAGAVAQDRERIEQAEIMLARRGHKTATSYTAEQLADLVMGYLSEPAATAFPFPWRRLNDGCGGGMRRGGVTLVGGWTGHGKSVFVDDSLSYVAQVVAARAHLYINELTPEERALRSAARESGVSYTRLLLKQLRDGEPEKIVAALSKGLPFGLTDVAGWTAAEIARDIRWRRWDVAGVDILHNIEYRDERDISTAMQILTAAALQAGTHLLVTVHLNEERARDAILPPPVLRDIRGSGMLKNLAHNVLFVHQDQELVDGAEQAQFTGEAGIYFAKTRSGAGGGIRTAFFGDRQHFADPSRLPLTPAPGGAS